MDKLSSRTATYVGLEAQQSCLFNLYVLVQIKEDLKSFVTHTLTLVISLHPVLGLMKMRARGSALGYTLP